MIIALHEQGYAEAAMESLKTNDTFRLQPWGTIEGVLKVGKRLATNETVMLTGPAMDAGGPLLQFDFQQFQSKTDAQGRFKITDVPPGEWSLVKIVPIDERSWAHTQVTPVKVKPGELTPVAMGGTGRRVIGKVIAPGYTNKIDWKNAGFQSLNTKQPRPPRNLRTPEEMAKWQESDEVKAARRNFRSYALSFSGDGSFRADDVLPGEYDLNIWLREPSPSGPGFGMGGKEIGQLHRDVTVADAAIKDSDEAFDLGTLPLRIKREFKSGDSAPAFDIKDVDGQPIKLSDFRDKFLLLHFWTTAWQPPTNEVTQLKGVFDRFRKNNRFALLTIDLDLDGPAIKKAVADLGISWKVGIGGEWNESALPLEYGLNGIPGGIFLVGPDGKLVARDLTADTLVAALDKALNVEPAQASAKDAGSGAAK